jgi:hypothetical protein
VAHKDSEIGFFVVRTGVHPDRGKIESEEVFRTLVRHANSHGAVCFFASVGIANAEGKTEAEMGVAVKGVAYNIVFDGLVKMAMPEKVGI